MNHPLKSHVAAAVLLSGVALAFASPVGAASTKVALRSIEIVMTQGDVVVTPCPTKGGQGICAKNFRIAGGAARFGSTQGDLRIAVPANVPVNIRSIQGDVTVSNIANPLQIETTQGDISSTSLSSKRASLITRQGDIRVTFTTDPSSVSAATTEGDIELRSLAPGSDGQVTASTQQGNITIAPAGPQMIIDARSGEGNVDVKAIGGPYKVQTSSQQGTVVSAIPSDVASARSIVAAALMQGDVHVH